MKEINKRGAALIKKQNAVEDKALAKIQSLDIPSSQKKNIELWIAYRKKAQSPLDVPTLSVDPSAVSKKDQEQALERRNDSTKADTYARLIGISNCSGTAVALKKNASLNSPTFLQYSTLVGLDKAQLPSKSGQVPKLDLPKRLSGEISKVTSPNEFKLKTGETYAIGGFSPGKTGSCYDKYVTKKLRSSLDGKSLTLEIPNHQTASPKQAYLSTETGDSLNLQAMLKGWAVPTSDPAKSDLFAEPMQISSRVAMTGLKGVWKACTAESVELSGLS